MAALHGDPAVSQNAQAQDVQGRLVDGRFVVADAGHQNTEDVLQHVRPFLRQGGNGLSQSAHGHLGRKGGGSPRQFLQLADGLLQLLVRQQAHEPPQIGRDEQGDLFLAGLQLTGQVDGDLIDLVHGQLRGNLQQMPARSLAHRQVLADGHQIGQVHGRVEGALRLLPHLPAQHLHLLQLDRPVDDVFQIAQMDLRDLLAGQRHKGLPQQKSLQIEEHGPVFILRRVIVQKHPLDDRPQSGKLLQMLQTAQADDLQLHLLAAEEFGEPPDERRALLLPEIPAGHVADGVDEGKAVEALGPHSPVKERLQKPGCLLFVAGGEQVLADDLQGVGNADGVLRRDLPLRVQALVNIVLPQLHRLRQQGHHCRRHGVGFCRPGPLLAVFGAAVGKNLPHDASGGAAHVAVRVHQKLIEQQQGLLLVGTGHVGAEFFQKKQIGSDALQILFALGLLQKLLQGFVRADGTHEGHAAPQGHGAKLPQRLHRGEQRRVRPGDGRQGVDIYLRRHAAADEHLLKVLQLGVDRAVAELLLGCHVI